MIATTFKNMLNQKVSDNMESKTEPICFNGMVMDFRDRLYWKFESEWNIQTLEDINNRLKLLNDGYMQNPKLEKIIHELEDLITKLLDDKTTNTNDLYQLETQLLNLIEGNPLNHRRLEG
jgi:uncharacterized protein YfkK (UPF0435 family)